MKRSKGKEENEENEGNRMRRMKKQPKKEELGRGNETKWEEKR